METYEKFCYEHTIKLIENDLTDEAIQFIEFTKNDIHIHYSVINKAIDKFNIDIIQYLIENTDYKYLTNMKFNNHLIHYKYNQIIDNPLIYFFLKSLKILTDIKKDINKVNTILKILKVFIVNNLNIITKNFNIKLIDYENENNPTSHMKSYYCSIQLFVNQIKSTDKYNYCKPILVIFTKTLINMIFLRTKLHITNDIKNYILEYLC